MAVAGGGIGGDPGAIEAAADDLAAAAADVVSRGEDVGRHGDAVVAAWQGTAADAAHERIRFLGDRTGLGGEVLAGAPAVLRRYAQALREAQAAYALGRAAATAASAAAESAAGAVRSAEAVPGDEPGRDGLVRRAGQRVDAARQDGASAADAMSAAASAGATANADAARAISALVEQMGAVAADPSGAAGAAAAPAPAGDGGTQESTWFFDRQLAGIASASLAGGGKDEDREGWSWFERLIGREITTQGEARRDDARRYREEHGIPETPPEDRAWYRDGSIPMLQAEDGFQHATDLFVDELKAFKDDPAAYAVVLGIDRANLFLDFIEDPGQTTYRLWREAIFADERDAGQNAFANGATAFGIPLALLGARKPRSGGHSGGAPHVPGAEAPDGPGSRSLPDRIEDRLDEKRESDAAARAAPRSDGQVAADLPGGRQNPIDGTWMEDPRKGLTPEEYDAEYGSYTDRDYPGSRDEDPNKDGFQDGVRSPNTEPLSVALGR